MRRRNWDVGACLLALIPIILHIPLNDDEGKLQRMAAIHEIAGLCAQVAFYGRIDRGWQLYFDVIGREVANILMILDGARIATSQHLRIVYHRK